MAVIAQGSATLLVGSATCPTLASGETVPLITGIKWSVTGKPLNDITGTDGVTVGLVGAPDYTVEMTLDLVSAHATDGVKQGSMPVPGTSVDFTSSGLPAVKIGTTSILTGKFIFVSGSWDAKVTDQATGTATFKKWSGITLT